MGTRAGIQGALEKTGISWRGDIQGDEAAVGSGRGQRGHIGISIKLCLRDIMKHIYLTPVMFSANSFLLANTV